MLLLLGWPVGRLPDKLLLDHVLPDSRVLDVPRGDLPGDVEDGMVDVNAWSTVSLLGGAIVPVRMHRTICPRLGFLQFQPP